MASGNRALRARSAPRAMIAGLEAILLEDEADGLTPLREAFAEVYGPADARVVRHERLRSHVYRVWLEVPAGPRSIIVKRLRTEHAVRERLLARRLLPAVGLEHLAPPLLAVAAEERGRRVWHLSEDVGGTTLHAGGVQQPALVAALQALAAVHGRFAAQPWLPRWRRRFGDLGAHFLAHSVAGARRGLEAVAARAVGWPERRATWERLDDRLRRLRDELPTRSAELEAWGGPPTLVHGDCHARNVLVGPDARSPIRLIDWDHSGVGPTAFDLSTLLRDVAPPIRGWALTQYHRALPGGWPAPPPERANRLFDSLESARLANGVTWDAVKILEGEETYGFDQFAMWEATFATLEPVLPEAAA